MPSGASLFCLRAIRAVWFAMLIVIVGCGGGSQTNLNNVVVTVAPASASVAAGGQVSLTATVTGLAGATPGLNWSINELQTAGASGAQCNWVGSTPPAGPCPDGTIQITDLPSTLTVTYTAPNSSGTFHVTAQWSTAFNPVIIKTATSTITVTP